MSHEEITEWHCEQCGERGRVSYPPDADVYRVLNLVDDAHNAVAPRSCQHDLGRVRVTRVTTST